MAQIIGYIGTSHVPAIGGAIARNLQQDPYWKPFFDGYPPVREWLAQVKPDVVVAFYNDHGLQFFLDKMPTFAVGAALEYRHADEGCGDPRCHSGRDFEIRSHGERTKRFARTLAATPPEQHGKGEDRSPDQCANQRRVRIAKGDNAERQPG